ncbi:MAG: hypothetical protein ABFD89_11310 [Bryobacteraceae bacterium]
MTDAQKQRLAEHLATKVCGWRLEGDQWQMPNGGTWPVCQWDPLGDARHTEVVMREWKKQGGELNINLGIGPVTCMAFSRAGNFGPRIVQSTDNITDWREAVCLAIGRASGFVGEEK